MFVIGGDAPRADGKFPDAYSLLQTMQAVGHPFEEIGIGGYPEGHAALSQDATDLALKQKAPLATHIITQICFDATATSSWAARIAAFGVGLPVRVGLPGPVSRQKLMRISAGIGLGQSARFLRKQQGLFWRFLLPGGYRPTRLAKQLGTAVTRTSNNIRGLHIFTFNELAKTRDSGGGSCCRWSPRWTTSMTGRLRGPVGASRAASECSEPNRRDFGRLIVQGADRPGIVASVSTVLSEIGANIVSLDQSSSDPSGGRFFQRTVFHLPDLPVRLDALREALELKLGAELGLDFRLVEAGVRSGWPSSCPKRTIVCSTCCGGSGAATLR